MSYLKIKQKAIHKICSNFSLRIFSQKQDEHNVYAIMKWKNVPSRLSPQWLCGNSCTWAHDVQLHIAGTNEPKSAQQVKQRDNISG